MNNDLLIVNAKVVTAEAVLEQANVRIKDGLIVSVEEQNAVPDADVTIIDAAGGWLLPGFIDVHVHGGYGADFMESDPETLLTITRYHAAHGTTAMLATTVTAPQDALDNVLAEVSRFMQAPMPYAQLLGVHLEGPFISPKWPGAQNPDFIQLPQLSWLEDWHARYPGIVRQLTLAPEREGALELITWLHERGIVAACGHTDSSYEEMIAAADAGLRQAVHTFNAMTGLHHRKPGTVGAVLTDPRIAAEVIADGHHVHPAAIRLITQVKQQQNLLLITDAMSAAGLGDGEYSLGGLGVIVQDGVARLKEGDSLAGSTLTMIDALRYMVREVGVSVAEASRYASGNPAKALGLEQRTGSIAAGKQADLLLLSPELDIQRTWIHGREIHAH
ncbi:N-acetylglucosamine-6-phosphate deacetylase [Paenibacillus eucommiae]|uniref:N-acetylglucosamine-6-phosphate deacetylase n=1 Tax=Paenibacillus eucommiae TaxID=1355755 RepID=A0ABS4J205_9BACL|nr:N-acetylglucosamine-6-phosphate deacetylase [Paenibacillus eucommiae]MBP1993286.1 N-acetylglucosamine-6-phosphate deacetylase [Paenibacillus eucommiae]